MPTHHSATGKPRAGRWWSVPALAGVLALAACAHPDPGFNAQAAAAQAPATVPPPVQPAARPGVGQELGAVADNQIVLTFPRGNAALAADQATKLDLASRLFRDANPTLMFVSGHSDNSGEEYSNLLLSARRAEMVKAALVARGIPSNRLLLQAMGTSDPADTAAPTAGDNRRVVITWRLL